MSRLESLVPRPRKIVPLPGVLDLASSVRVDMSEVSDEHRARAIACLDLLPFRVEPSGPLTTSEIVVSLGHQPAAESYRVVIDTQHCVLEAGSLRGLGLAVQTLRQLLPDDAYRRRPSKSGWLLPCCTIEDAPELAWRGLLLDVARHFMPASEVRALIDAMAVHKLNTLQLHLTDDQGWRFESHRFPRLHQVGSVRSQSQISHPHDEVVLDGTPHGGYYTQDDLREIVAYAADRGIDVVPEIDVPAHSRALLAAYPELAVAGSGAREVETRWAIHPCLLAPLPETLSFLQDLLSEVMEVFPSRYVHLGGDESVLDAWFRDPRVSGFAAENGHQDERSLFAWFMAELAVWVTEQGRSPVMWDDAYLAGKGTLPSTTVITAWLEPEIARDAAAYGHPVVMCPVMPTYFDYAQDEDDREPLALGGPVRLEDVAALDPRPAGWTGAERAEILGTQCGLWTELISDPRYLQYMAFPRASAFAEVAWTGHPVDPVDITAPLRTHLGRLDALGVEYRPLDGPRPWQQAGSRRRGLRS